MFVLVRQHLESYMSEAVVAPDLKKKKKSPNQLVEVISDSLARFDFKLLFFQCKVCVPASSYSKKKNKKPQKPAGIFT